ncbi:hypothetical protein BGZ54_005058 [Gamsiella multidivaricata]|nr:hypothetical protein BGZ54_005058 [Gamsiella multidivaricata]
MFELRGSWGIVIELEGAREEPGAAEPAEDVAADAEALPPGDIGLLITLAAFDTKPCDIENDPDVGGADVAEPMIDDPIEDEKPTTDPDRGPELVVLLYPAGDPDP